MTIGSADDPRRWTRVEALLLVSTLIAAAVTLFQSWNRWVDPIVDSGRDPYIAEQLHHGLKLYRDIIYIFPPLTPYLLSAITLVTGNSLGAYAGIGLAIAALTALAMWKLAASVANRTAAGAATLLFAGCSIATPWSRNGSYAIPYAYAATLAMLFFVAFGAFMALYLYVERRPRYIVAALAAALAAAWTKIEFAAFTAALLLLLAIVHRIRVRWLAAYASAFAILLGLTWVIFRDAPPNHPLFSGNILPSAMFGSRWLGLLYANVAGTGNWRFLLLVSFLGSAVFSLIVVLLHFAEGKRRIPLLVAASLVAIGFSSELFFRAWTVLGVVALIVALRRPREPLLLLSALALCAMSRIPLNVSPQWYGFVFCVPVYLLMAYVVFEWLPARNVYGRKQALVWLLAFFGATVQWTMSARPVFAEKIHPIETVRGTLYDDNGDRAAILADAFGELRARGIRAVAFMPEGLMLNYLSGTRTPLAHHAFTPAETGTPASETAALEELASVKPEWIAVVARDMREYGVRGFGIDYDLRLTGYVRAGYAVDRRWSRPGFEFVLLHRKTASDPRRSPRRP